MRPCPVPALLPSHGAEVGGDATGGSRTSCSAPRMPASRGRGTGLVLGLPAGTPWFHIQAKPASLHGPSLGRLSAAVPDVITVIQSDCPRAARSAPPDSAVLSIQLIPRGFTCSLPAANRVHVKPGAQTSAAPPRAWAPGVSVLFRGKARICCGCYGSAASTLHAEHGHLPWPAYAINVPWALELHGVGGGNCRVAAHSLIARLRFAVFYRQASAPADSVAFGAHVCYGAPPLPSGGIRSDSMTATPKVCRSMHTISRHAPAHTMLVLNTLLLGSGPSYPMQGTTPHCTRGA